MTPFRVVSGLLAAALMVGFIAPVVVKLNDVALWTVAAAGTAMMLVDLWQSLRSTNGQEQEEQEAPHV